jgi:hypothetical protein
MVPNVGRFDDVPLKKETNQPAPEWMVEGVAVVHDTFGRGVVRHVGLYKRFHTVWIEFDEEGVKALAPKYAMPHMRRAGPDTAPRPDTAPSDPVSRAVSRFGPWAGPER